MISRIKKKKLGSRGFETDWSSIISWNEELVWIDSLVEQLYCGNFQCSWALNNVRSGEGGWGTDLPCSCKSTYKALHIHSSETMDSTNGRSCSTVVFTMETKICIWVELHSSNLCCSRSTVYKQSRTTHVRWLFKTFFKWQNIHSIKFSTLAIFRCAISGIIMLITSMNKFIHSFIHEQVHSFIQ